MNDSLHLLAGAYAVDALDPDERAVFEEHLTGCPECTQEVRELQATAARLGAADPAVPPSSLRVSVLAEVARTPQQHPPGTAPAAAAAAAGQPSGTVVVPMHRRRTQQLLVLAAAVLAVFAVGLGALLVQTRSDRTALADRQQQLTAVLTAPDAKTVGAPVAGGGRAAVVVSDSRGEAAFVAADLPAPPTGHVYQLWFITAGGKAASAGVFSPGTHGSAAVLMQGDPAGAAQVGLTVEPDGGSSQPTTTPVVGLPISPQT